MKRAFHPLLLLAAWLRVASASACGWSYTGEEFRFWLLQPELAEAHALHPFYYTTEVIRWMDQEELMAGTYRTNLAEWQAIVGKDVPDTAIAQVLYGLEPQDYWRERPTLEQRNIFLLRLAHIGRGWPAFIPWAKTCEELVNGLDPWGFAEHDQAAILRTWNDGLQLLAQAKDKALRARIAYQLVRLAAYAEEEAPMRDKVKAIYAHELLPLHGHTWLEPSAAFYLANMQRPPERDLAFARIFPDAPDKQFRMVQLFVTSATDDYLDRADNDRHRAYLLVMRDLQHPGRALADLERIAAWDPGNPYLPLLLSREVNKLEDWLLTPELTTFGTPAIDLWQDRPDSVSQADVTAADLAYLQRVREFIAHVRTQAAAKDRALLTLLDGHLSLIAGDAPACLRTLMALGDDRSLTDAMRLQLRLDRVLCGMLGQRQMTDAVRDDILALIEHVNAAEALPFDRGTLLAQLHLYLGRKLMARGEMAEGAFLLARSQRLFGDLEIGGGTNARCELFEQAAPADYDRMITWLDKPDKTRYERYLTGASDPAWASISTQGTFEQNGLSRNTLLDYKATWYVQRDRLEEALMVLQQVPDTFWGGWPYTMFQQDDPFVVNIEDPHNYAHKDQGHYTKRTIVERMIDLKQDAARHPRHRALDEYLLGNAYYNMTWHGKYWIMQRIQWTRWAETYGDPVTRTPQNDAYFGCAAARTHYEAVLRSAKDPVLKAMACRMVNECDQNWRWYTGDNSDVPDPYKDLLTDAKSREAYEAIQDCSRYADFVARFR